MGELRTPLEESVSMGLRLRANPRGLRTWKYYFNVP